MSTTALQLLQRMAAKRLERIPSTSPVSKENRESVAREALAKFSAFSGGAYDPEAAAKRLEPHQEVLQRYRQKLPEYEYWALETWLGTFYPFQLGWLLDPAELAITNKSRQTGVSHTTGAVAALWGVFDSELTTIISEGDREAKEVLEKVKDHVATLKALGSKLAETVKFNATEIKFASNGRVLALPSTGGRGFTGNVFLDEFAYHDHAAKVWDAAAAVTLLKGRIRVCSTPNGVGNDFHNLWRRALEEPSWSAHELPIALAIEQGYPVNDDKCWELAKGDPRLYDQLFNCKFLDGELQYLPSALVESCQVGREELEEGSGPYVAGLDVGKNVDLTVLIVLKKYGGKLRLAYVEQKKRTDAAGLQSMVDRAFAKFSLYKLCVDATGIGSFPAEEMQTRHGFYQVEAVNFGLKSKEELATGLYVGLNEKTILIPKEDSDIPEPPEGMPEPTAHVAKLLKEDLCSLRRIISNAGNVKYDAPHTDQGHADRAWALALAVKAGTDLVEYSSADSVGAMF